MPLKYADDRGPWEHGGVLRFQAYDGDAPVVCGVARGVLETLEGRSVASEELEAVLKAHRAAVRAAVERKYETGPIEADGAVIVYGEDL